MKSSIKIIALAAASALALAACGGGGNTGTTPGTDTGTPAGTETDSGGGGGGGGTSVTWKLAFNQPETHPEYIASVNMAKKLEEQTDGRVKIEIFPNELLGSQTEVMEAITQNSVEMQWTGAPPVEALNPDFVVFNLPYMFDSPEVQIDVTNDPDVVGDLYKSLEESKNITVLAAAFAGVRNFYTSKHPIRTLNDMVGLKLRVQQSESQIKMVELLGATATPMGFGDVYTALQSGVIDGAENNEVSYEVTKHFETAKYYSFTRHLMIPDYFLISTKALNAISDEDRETFLSLIPDMIAESNQGMLDMAAEALARVEALGVESNDDVEVQQFKDAMAPIYDQFITNDVTKALFEAVQAANEAHK